MATNNPGIVDGEDTGENMGVGYDDSNAPTDQGGDLITDGADTIYGNGGDDTIDGGDGNDVIFGDNPEGETLREIFQWLLAPGFANGATVSGFTQDTGNANITFSIETQSGDVTNTFEDNDQLTTDLDDAVNENASFQSLLDSNGSTATYQWESDVPLQNVEFRINDLDGGGVIEIRAYDEFGNEIPVSITDAGSGIATSSNNGLAGDNVAESVDGNYTSDDNPEHSMLVTIDGPVAYWEVTHTMVGDDNTGINVTDIAFDVGGGDELAGNDEINGGDGNDFIDGQQGDDTLIGGNGRDTVEDLDGNNEVDTSSTNQAPLPDIGFPAYGPFPAVPADGDPDDDRDLVTTGDGDDTITTGDDADTISSGGGADVIDSGIDNDEVDAGDGDDVITAGEGNDTVLGGEGNDTIFGGLGPTVPDVFNIPDAPFGGTFGPDPEDNNGRDLLDGGAGDDEIYGEDDDDTLIGGEGDDTLDAGIDDDEMTGGDGNDVFIEEAGSGADTVTDFNDGNTGPINDGDQTNNDFVDLSGFYNDTTVTAVNDSDGDTSNDFDNALQMLRADAEDGRIDGVIGGTDYKAQIGDVDITLQDSSGTATGNELTFDNTNVACFVRGTQIATRRGSVPIEELKAGDEVITMDHGFQKIRWIGSTTVPAEGSLAPVVFRRGAMGNERDLRVSPQHRMLVRGWHVELMFGQKEALVPAKALINDETVFQLEGGSVDYFHMMFDRHELVYAEGIPSESFHPGHVGLGSFSRETREEILGLFPQLREDAGAYSEPVRPSLKVREAKVLAENPELMKE